MSAQAKPGAASMSTSPTPEQSSATAATLHMVSERRWNMSEVSEASPSRTIGSWV